jgi:molybdopterin/thiamine biosynthesis adenylyltransferase
LPCLSRHRPPAPPSSALYLNNDAAFFAGKPLIYGSIFRFEGQVSFFDPTNGDPCYRCLFPRPAAPGRPDPGAPAASGRELGALPLPRRITLEPERPEQGLVTLVLTVVELLRQLMERQALRRLEHGHLTEEQIERLGAGLFALEQRMGQLRDQFGLTEQDLNLDLGPLGTLLPSPSADQR